MCILCAIQKWSRRVATMLPWLVIPLIGLWALSQLLPPPFRFEITSPRLACVFVLLVTLFWYEVLMPQLSAWRVRRNARLRERKQIEAIELQKLRKTATRRCRNCLTPYRDQNPGGGRFTCSYCGHISKRPILDLPVPRGMGMSSSGIIKDLVGKGGKIFNGKGWSESGWICGQDWLENNNWNSGRPSYWRKNGSGIFGGKENCLAEKSYSGVAIFSCKLLTDFFFSIWWLCRKIFRVGSSTDDALSDPDRRGMFDRRGENGTNCHESRGEKARRKAEEKRQARIEKELLEEEERKQREEVARLVEERRRLRDEKMEAENDRSKLSVPVREKESRKEAEKRHQERRKDKDKAFSKSNADAEEVEKRTGRETERKRELDKKSEIDRRENQKFGTDTDKVHCMETGHGHGIKNTPANSFSRGNAGNRYLDRMKGTFLSSKAFTESGFFGKIPSATTTREHKTNSSVDHAHNLQRRDNCPTDSVTGRSSLNGDDKNSNTHRSVLSKHQTTVAPKKSWHQLFTRSSIPASSNGNVISRPNSKLPAEGQNMQLRGHSSSIQMFDNPISFGLPSPLISTYPNNVTSSSLGFSAVSKPMFLQAAEVPQFIPEEQELFEDPCYVPDPVTLLGPVSESLDEFQLDYGSSVAADTGLEKSCALRNVSASEISKPSPIESPLSRLRVANENQNSSNRFPVIPKIQDVNVDDAKANEKGMWQMWNGPFLGQDGLGLVGGQSSWLLHSEKNILNKEDFMHPSTQKTMGSLFMEEEPTLVGTHSPHKVFIGACQNGGTFSSVTSTCNQDPWLQNALFPPFSGSDSHIYLMPQGEKGETAYQSACGSSNSHSFEPSPSNGWSKKERAGQSAGEGVGKSYVGKGPGVGGLFPEADVQSIWSFD